MSGQVQLGTGNFLLVDHDEGRQDVDDLDGNVIRERDGVGL